MAQNRYLPFGYRVELGKIVADGSEADTIRKMFRRYAEGAALKAIAEELSVSGPAYIDGKPTWNKNMVARILQNRSYLGTEKYPSILECGEFTDAQKQKEQKPYTITEPPALKQIKKLFVCAVCGEPLGRRIKTQGGERWHCRADLRHISLAVNDTLLLKNIHSLFCTLPKRPELQPQTQGDIEPNVEILRLQNELNAMFDREINDEQMVQKPILRLAAEKYRVCDDSISLSARLQEQCEAELDAYLLLEIVSEIVIGKNGEVSIKLKNGQAIQPSERSEPNE